MVLKGSLVYLTQQLQTSGALSKPYRHRFRENRPEDTMGSRADPLTRFRLQIFFFTIPIRHRWNLIIGRRKYTGTMHNAFTSPLLLLLIEKDQWETNKLLVYI